MLVSSQQVHLARRGALLFGSAKIRNVLHAAKQSTAAWRRSAKRDYLMSSPRVLAEIHRAAFDEFPRTRLAVDSGHTEVKVPVVVSFGINMDVDM